LPTTFPHTERLHAILCSLFITMKTISCWSHAGVLLAQVWLCVPEHLMPQECDFQTHISNTPADDSESDFLDLASMSLLQQHMAPEVSRLNATAAELSIHEVISNSRSYSNVSEQDMSYVSSRGSQDNEQSGSYNTDTSHPASFKIKLDGSANSKGNPRAENRTSKTRVKHGAGTAHQPRGVEIWNASVPWETMQEGHPGGVHAHTSSGKVRWANVSHMSFPSAILLTLVAYPALLMFATLAISVIMGMILCTAARRNFESSSTGGSLLAQSPGQDGHFTDFGYSRRIVHGCDFILPVLETSLLPPTVSWIYEAWMLLCRTIPFLTVFGLTFALAFLSRSHPQEVFAILKVMTTGCMFAQCLYLATFAPLGLMSMQKTMNTYQAGTLKGDRKDSSACTLHVCHWVIIPQYLESEDIVSMVLASISKAKGACSSIGVMLAMESREAKAVEKANYLKQRFDGKFRDLIATYHPAGLPNDPPGKASNVAWAFTALLKHLQSTDSSSEHVLITVADADSNFYPAFFEALEDRYVEEDPDKRKYCIWQTPIFHVKNYFRQPAPVVVGTVLTSMFEVATLADPNAARFPYSTYSLTLDLAKEVGGWDPMWIAEDWHMGIKAFLFTFGKVVIKPIMLPTINYTPEEATWWGTIQARWVQAKRHSLGFSDLAFYFMTLPLLVAHALGEWQSGRESKQPHTVLMRKLFGIVIRGVPLVIKIINTHVILGVGATYAILVYVLQVLMLNEFPAERTVEHLLDRTNFIPVALVTASQICTVITSCHFLWAYKLLKPAVDREKSNSVCFSSSLSHFVYIVFSMLVCGLLFFVASALATWRAAISVAVSKTFTYEVAPKPAKQTTT